MAASAEFKVILTIDSQGNAKIEEVKRSLKDVGDTAKSANQEGAASADEFAGALVRQLGLYALLVAGVYKLEQAVVGGFKAGIQAVDDFRLTTIGVAATLTDLGKEGSNAQLDYARNIAYSKDMYGELELAAARHFASGKDLVQAFNILSQKGIVLRKEEIDDLGTIVDKIKLATAGQVQAIQISQELRAMLSGQARATDQMAMMLKDRYGAEWEAIVKKHREAGDLIHWLAGEFKGLIYAGQDVQGTLMSQKTTLETLLTQVGRAGLTGAYEDIVGWMKQINSYLREHREEIGGGINRGWVAVKELVEGAYGFIKEISNVANKGIVIPITFSIGGAAKWLAEGAGPMGDFGFGGLDQTGIEPTLEFKQKENQRLAEQIARYKKATYEMYVKDLGVAPVRPIRPEEDGKGTEAAERKIENIVNTLRQEIARLSEGDIGGILGWANKTITEIERVGAAYKDYENAKSLLADATNLKIQKSQETFSDWYAGHIHNDYAKLDAETEKLLRKYTEMPAKMLAALPPDLAAKIDIKGLQQWAASAKEAVGWMKEYQTYKLDMKSWEQLTAMQEKYLKDIAAASPFLIEQLGYQKSALELALALDRAKLEQYILDKELVDQQRAGQGIAPFMTEEIKAQLRGMQAQSEELKRQEQLRKEWATQGIAGGVKLIIDDLKHEQEIWMADAIRDGFRRSRSWVEDSLSSAIWGALTRDKTVAARLGQEIAQGFITNTVKLGLHAFTGLFISSLEKAVSTLGGEAAGKAVGGVLGSITGQVAGQAAGAGAGAAALTTAAAALMVSSLLLDGSSLLLDGSSLLLDGSSLLLDGSSLLLDGSAGLLGGAASALGIAAGMLMAAAAVPFHSGGIVAHEGLILTAHGGLNLDERFIRAQVGEWVINRTAAGNLARLAGPDTFPMLNAGRLPVLAAPGPESAPQTVNFYYSPAYSAIDSRGMKQVLKDHRDDVFEVVRGKIRDGARLK